MSITSKRIVVLPDIHVPNHEEIALRPILKFIKFYKPDTLVQLGDFCDWDSVSSYDLKCKEDLITVEHEVASSNYLLDDLDKTSGRKCQKIMIGGNHEARLTKFIASDRYNNQVKKMVELTSWQKSYNLDKRGWQHCEYGGHFNIGKIIFTHGWYASGNAASKMAQCFPGKNVIFGHTHKHLIHGCMDENNLPIETESIGTLSRFDLSYLDGRPPIDWIHSFMYIDMSNNGTFSKHYVRVINGSFVEYGKRFGCEVI